MIASWMIYTLLVGGLVSLAALAAERALLLLRLPVRWVWAAALALSLLIPCLAHFMPSRVAIPRVIKRSMLDTVYLTSPPKVLSWPYRSTPPSTGIPIGKALGIGWAVASLGLAQLVIFSMAVLQGRRREWRRVVVDGVDTLVAPDFGPAVVGWRRLEIVLPTWALALAEDARALVVRHEQEHLRHGDPRLLIHASLVVLAIPWNPALWWQYRRLRRAIELDCDARVVRGGADVGRYGVVLLEAGGFCRRNRFPALAAFTERAIDLEARIKALTPGRSRWRGARVGVAGFGACFLVAAAGLIPDPLSPSPWLPETIVLNRVSSAPDTTSLTTWARDHLPPGYFTSSTVAMFRSHEGKLLGTHLIGGGPKSLDKNPLAIAPGDIESVEVLKGVQGIPNVSGSVIVITLNPGRRLSEGMDDTFRQYVACMTMELWVGGVRMIRSNGTVQCR
ncbi:MAG TPA: M56 family metallopeptidase [Gemmatimonadales bacterium]|nr:M56 family metallopeptidase [Gemmatimonadales bacterium]